MNPATLLSIPPECSEFIRKDDDSWRPTEQELRHHVTEGLMPSFITLATNGELTIVRCTQSGRLAQIKSANIARATRAQALRLPSTPKPQLSERDQKLKRIEALKKQLQALQAL